MDQIIYSLTELAALRAAWQAAGLKVVLTNGVFDLVHIGHINYLKAARALGDRLIVAINSDESTRHLKGPLRPIVPAMERATIIAALRCVDAVTIFAERTAETVVATLKPDLYVKGGDYGNGNAIDEARLPEARIARAYGGEVRLLPFHEGYATTQLIERIVERYRHPPQS
ncbi:MAG: ADP-heptose synthase [Chloroflexus sp.]|jgi:rfaE bifunctional protein nucleotidyltransferase chain/domain|uniref:adenylyltransferase/cytidyltransferase family protein n=1 Tax=Chloroflexus sp. TaxID=1904827 RepID=UPI0021DEEE81|nr:adenylyltransferase/cytidyltransferase family protein [Chloroflexus sp.]GIV90694.1 MAG: ADP-heptose synthase [Chloroflexus sp.]